MTYRIPDEFMEPFIIRLCDECGLEHAPVRTCDETILARAYLGADQ